MSRIRLHLAAVLAVASLAVQADAPRTPAESARSFRVAEGLVFEPLLSEPEIAQPVSLTFDERGRLWVVEYRQYPNPAGLRQVSHDQFWRAVYDRVPEPPPRHVRGADRISIHEDTDGDGTLDRHSVFVDGLNIATSVAFGRGGVFVLNPPYLLFYPDRDHNDVPDGDPQVLLSGFGLEDTHSVANSLRWGPDGWLYGCQGSTVTANIRVHGADGKPATTPPQYSQGQNIWRYHPERRVYEVFSEGGGNAFGLEIDSAGRIFSGHNGGNTRGFHYQQGAYLQKGFDKHGPLSNAHAFGYFPAMSHPEVDRFTHTFVIYDSGALGKVFQGRLFGVEPLQGRVVMSEVVPEGSTFRTRDIGHAVTSEDRWFRPVDIELGPDGALYVADWYDAQVNHYRNHEGMIDASNGRVYRLAAAGNKRERVMPLSLSRPDELLTALDHPNRWYRQQALRMLGDQTTPIRPLDLGEILRRSGPRTALNALWALHLAGRLDEGLALSALDLGDAQIRAWTIRLMGDEGRMSSGLSVRLAQLALTEPEIEVRAQLACTARRLPVEQGLPMVRGLLSRDVDAEDARQPLLLWWAIENACTRNRESVVALVSDRELWKRPLFQRHVLSRLMRRFSDTGKAEDLAVAARLLVLSPDVASTHRLVQGFEEAFQGRALSGVPDLLLEALDRAGGVSPVLGIRRGNPKAIEGALALVADPKADLTRRLQVVAALGEVKLPQAIPGLLTLVRGTNRMELRRAALGALQIHEDPLVARQILASLPELPADLRGSAVALLAGRATWTAELLSAVEAGRIDRKLVPMDQARSLRGVGPEAARRVGQLWPDLAMAPSGAAMESEIVRLSAVIHAEGGSPYPGKKLFSERCGVCHRLFARGGEVGPDLTAFQRTDLANLLLNIVNPSAEIREGYEAYSVETRDGRNFTGFLVDRDAQGIVLRTSDGRTLSLASKDVEAMERASGSLMPEGLLSGLSDTQVRDLFAYLRSTQPLNDGN